MVISARSLTDTECVFKVILLFALNIHIYSNEKQLDLDRLTFSRFICSRTHTIHPLSHGLLNQREGLTEER